MDFKDYNVKLFVHFSVLITHSLNLNFSHFNKIDHQIYSIIPSKYFDFIL